MNTFLTLLAFGTTTMAVTGAAALIAAMLHDRSRLQPARHRLEQTGAGCAVAGGMPATYPVTRAAGTMAANDGARRAA